MMGGNTRVRKDCFFRESKRVAITAVVAVVVDVVVTRPTSFFFLFLFWIPLYFFFLAFAPRRRMV